MLDRSNKHDSYPEEHKVFARGLFIQGLSLSRIAQEVQDRFDGATCTLETIERWRDNGNWIGMRDGVQQEVADRQRDDIAQRLLDHADSYREAGERAIAAIRSGSLGIRTVGEASSVLDTAIKGERQSLQDYLKLDFLKMVYEIIDDEVTSEDEKRQIGVRFRKILGLEVKTD